MCFVGLGVWGIFVHFVLALGLVGVYTTAHGTRRGRWVVGPEGLVEGFEKSS